MSFGKKIIFIVSTLLCFCQAMAIPSLPSVSFNVEQSNYYGLIYNPSYANLLSPESALGFEVAIGGSEFRLGATFAKILQTKHSFKLTGEYLAQQNRFTFLDISTLLWTNQYAFAAGYSYLLDNACIRSFNLSVYATESNNTSLPAVFDYGDNVHILYRDIRGSNNYGTSVGFVLQPFIRTQIKGDFYYDATSFRNNFELKSNTSGPGVAIEINQIIHPRILMQIRGMQREVYDQYRGKISWLIPTKCCAFLELSLLGQYVSGDLPEPKESRVGMMLTYRWDLPRPVENYLTPMTLQESVVSAAMNPLIRMPETRVYPDQKIIN